MSNPADPFDLNRFLTAQEGVYRQVLAELNEGRKQTHWMWFIFPQMEGLGNSPTARHYAIKSKAEARQYWNHPVLGARLRECTEAVLAVKGRTALDIFGHPDDMKLRSSMTLFMQIAGSDPLFARVLDKYFHSEPDAKTMDILKR